MFKKSLAAALSAAIMLSGAVVFADASSPLLSTDFADQKGVDAFMEGGIEYTDYGTNVWGKKSFVGGLGDKAASDLSYAHCYTKLPASASAVFCSNDIFAWEQTKSESIASKAGSEITREFSLYYDGSPVTIRTDVKAAWFDSASNKKEVTKYITVKVGSNGALNLELRTAGGTSNESYVSKDVYSEFKAGKWYRIAYTLKPAENKMSFYVDGVCHADNISISRNASGSSTLAGTVDYATYSMTSGVVTGINQRITVTNTSAEISAGCIAIDDYMVYEGAYDNSAAEKIIPQISASAGMKMLTDVLYVPAGTSYASFMSAVSVEDANASVVVYTDNTKTATVTEGNIAEGNILTTVSGDNRFSYDYTITTNADVLITKFVDFEEDENMGFEQGFEPTSYSYPENLGGKVGDKSLSAVRTTTGTETDDVCTRFILDNGFGGKDTEAQKIAGSDYTMQFQFYMGGDGGTVSLVSNSYLTKSTGYGQDIKYLFFIDADGNFAVGADRNLPGNNVAKVNKNEWNTIAVEITEADAMAEIYLNGVSVGETSLMRWPNGATATFNGFRWTTLYCTMPKDTVAKSATFAIDNFQANYGLYNNKPEFECEIDVEQADNNVIYAAGMSFEELASAITLDETYTPSLYTDNTYSEIVEDLDYELEDGNVLVFASKDGRDIRYYTVKNSDPVYGDINLTKSEDGKTFAASVSAWGSASNTDRGVLYLAIYQGTKMVDVVLSEIKVISGDVSFSASYTAESLDGLTAKAMFWKHDTFTPLVPYVVK